MIRSRPHRRATRVNSLPASARASFGFIIIRTLAMLDGSALFERMWRKDVLPISPAAGSCALAIKCVVAQSSGLRFEPITQA
jgi:hypothetical protein